MFDFDPNDDDLEAQMEMANRLLNPATRLHFEKRFAQPIRLTPIGFATSLFALGRSKTDLLVETRYSTGDSYGPQEFGIYITHSPELALQVPESLVSLLKVYDPDCLTLPKESSKESSVVQEDTLASTPAPQLAAVQHDDFERLMKMTKSQMETINSQYKKVLDILEKEPKVSKGETGTLHAKERFVQPSVRPTKAAISLIAVIFIALVTTSLVANYKQNQVILKYSELVKQQAVELERSKSTNDSFVKQTSSLSEALKKSFELNDRYEKLLFKIQEQKSSN